MFTLVLKDGRQISTLNPEDVSEFWDKECELREIREREAKKKQKKSK